MGPTRLNSQHVDAVVREHTKALPDPKGETVVSYHNHIKLQTFCKILDFSSDTFYMVFLTDKILALF